MDYFKWDRFVSAFWMIIPYLKVTLGFVAVTIVLSTILAVVIALLRIKQVPVVKQIMSIYVSYMRGVPFLVQLMVVYYGFPIFIYAVSGANIQRWNGFFFAAVAMILNEAAFLGESIRGAILSVNALQIEAAYSIGMTSLQTFNRVIFPQAVRILIPVYGVALVGMLQSTSMLYTIGVMDIMQRSKSVATITGHAFEGYMVCALVYIVFSLLIRVIFAGLEKKMSYGKVVA